MSVASIGIGIGIGIDIDIDIDEACSNFVVIREKPAGRLPGNPHNGWQRSPELRVSAA